MKHLILFALLLTGCHSTRVSVRYKTLIHECEIVWEGEHHVLD